MEKSGEQRSKCSAVGVGSRGREVDSHGREEVGSCGGEGWVGWVAGGKGVWLVERWWAAVVERVLGWWGGRRGVWLVGRGGGGWGACRTEQLWWVAEMVECFKVTE